jgi:flagellar motility protein MotE (MotC chaperone)
MSMLRIPPRVFLPMMMFVGVLIVGLRAGDVWKAATEGVLFAPVQRVQAEEKAPPQKQENASKQQDPKPTTAPAAQQQTASDAPSPKQTQPLSPEEALFKQLEGRRDQLDARAKNIDAREAMVKIAEQRVEQKISEMKTLKTQLEALLGQANGAQAAQIENLVKIYETMKPKEAARIFETMEMPVLLNVVQRMKPARTAAVLAEMDPMKAKEITIALTRQDQLPQVK